MNGLIICVSFLSLQSCREGCKICTCSVCHCHMFASGYSQKYKEYEKTVRVEEIDGVKLVKNLAVKMEEVFRKKAEATRVCKTCMKNKYIDIF